jgi:hypothetical protein
MDDLVGGPDLVDVVDRELARALTALDAGRTAERHRLLPADRRRLLPAAELAQLTAWVAADAGDLARAGRAHRVGVRLAAAAGDRPLLGHLLGSMAHIVTGHDPPAALALARRAYAVAAPCASARGRALLLHRIAFAAARTGARRDCEHTLAAAERAYDRHLPDTDPPWLYWFDDAELIAMTGRCYAALGRPRLAAPLLNAALGDGPRAAPGSDLRAAPGDHLHTARGDNLHTARSDDLRAARGGDRIRLRSAALYSAWLALAHLDAGDVEEGCAVAGAALLTTVRVGSVRALRQVTALHPRLGRFRAVPAVRDYTERFRQARPYLPGGAPVRRGPDDASVVPRDGVSVGTGRPPCPGGRGA